MHKQRIVLILAAAAGALSGLMPWQTFIYLSRTGMDIGQAWIVFAIFGAALGATLIGNWASPPAGFTRGAGGLLGLGAIGFGIWKLIEIRNGTLGLGGELGEMQRDQPMVAETMKSLFDPGMGIYTMIGAGAVVAIAALYRGRRSTLLPRGPFAD